MILIAPPCRQDSFQRTVVVVVKHSDHGALGLILNRIENLTVENAWRNICQERISRRHVRQSLNDGGPVAGYLMAIHRVGWAAESEICNGMYFSWDKKNLKQILRQDKPLRIYCGAVFWRAGQLDNEIASGQWWCSTRVLTQYIFGPSEGLWRMMLDDLGRSVYDAIVFMQGNPELN